MALLDLGPERVNSFGMLSSISDGFQNSWDKSRKRTQEDEALALAKQQRLDAPALIEQALGQTGYAAPSGGGLLPGATGASASTGNPNIDAAREAIAKIESSGNYGAVGPQTKTGDRAYGRYQVMGANIPSWTREALGREMTPQEFMADTKAQDAVFNHHFGKSIAKYGNAQDAASIWFTGRPASQGGNAADVTGTTGNQYVRNFNNALGSQSGNRLANVTPVNDLVDRGNSGPPQINDLVNRGQPQASAQNLAAAPNDPEVSVPGYPGTWSRKKWDASPDNDPNVPDEAELVAAQRVAGGVSGAPATQVAQAPSPVASDALRSGAGIAARPQASATLIAKMLMNPVTAPLAQKMLDQSFGGKFTFHQVGEALVRTNNVTGQWEEVSKNTLSPLDAQEKQAKIAKIQAETRDLGIPEPAVPKFREFNGRVFQEMPDGSLKDATPNNVQPAFQPMSPEQRKAFNVPDGTPAFVGPDGKPMFGPASRAEQGEFKKSADKKMAEIFSTYAEGVPQSVNILQETSVLKEFMNEAPQGFIKGKLAEQFPGISTYGDLFQSRIKSLAPQLRIAGSGATSDKDLDAMLASLPSLKFTPEANKAIMQVVEAKANLNIQRGEVARKALRGEISQEEADKQISSIDRVSVITPELRSILGVKSGVAQTTPNGSKASGTSGGLNWSVK